MKKIISNLLLRAFKWCVVNGDDQERRSMFSIFNQNLLITPTLYGPAERLNIGPRVSRSNTLFNTRSGTINIGQGVMLSPGCKLLTGFHDYTKPGENRQRVTLEDAGRDITINDGAWIASEVIVIGPCTIGKNAVIGAGSVVVKNIPDNVFAAGNPARVIRKIEISDCRGEQGLPS